MDLRESGHGFQEIHGARFENQCRSLSGHAEKETEPASKHCGIKTLNNGHVKISVTKTATLYIKPSDQLLNIISIDNFIMNPVLYRAVNPQFSGLKKL
jgi:hypothetical protein